MGLLPISQRRWAMGNPRAAYRKDLSLEDYLGARVVYDPLSAYDCVPVVSGAEAILISHQVDPGQHVEVVAQELPFNLDDQLGDGFLDTQVVANLSANLYSRAGLGVEDIDVVGVYDDYPVMAIEQARAFGVVKGDDVRRYLHDQLDREQFPVNTSGGQLSAGQAGCGAGLHFIVEAVQQLLGHSKSRQVPGARHALVSNYGMVTYRHGACLAGTILRRGEK